MADHPEPSRPRYTTFWQGQTAEAVEAVRETLRDPIILSLLVYAGIAVAHAHDLAVTCDAPDDILLRADIWRRVCGDVPDLDVVLSLLTMVVRQRVPRLAHLYGERLPNALYGIALAQIGLDDAARLHLERLWRFLPDNPITFPPVLKGNAAVPDDVDGKHLFQLKSYFKSRKPATPLGRPRKPATQTPRRPPRRRDAERERLARLAYQMHSNGAHWTAIARKVYPDYNHYSKPERERIRKRVARLVDRGSILASNE